MNDIISIIGIEAVGFHGVFPEERRDGQKFLVDVHLEMEVNCAGDTDQLSDAIDYSLVAARVGESIAGEPFNLIEKMAEVIAADLLNNFKIKSVEVVVHKPDAPMSIGFRDVSIRIKRSR